MIIDGNFLADGTCIKCDVMIVGAGMAGLCIANSLSKYGIDTCIIESGGEVLDHFSTSLSEGEGYLSDDNGVKICMKNYMYESRQRSLGGTGNLARSGQLNM